MPRPNFYMSDKDKATILEVITNYISMWDDADGGMNEDEYKEITRIRKKIRDMNKSQGFKNAIIEDALDIANKVLVEKRKRQGYESPTCSTCEHWDQNKSRSDGMGYCPLLKEHTELDESCNDFEDIK